MTNGRIRPGRIEPRDYTGAIVADGTYGLAVSGGVIGGLAEVSGGVAAPSPRLALFKITGTLIAGVGATLLPNDTNLTWTLTSVRASVETAPSGGSVVVDVNKNGTTVFTTQANRPTITTGTLTSGKITAIDVTTVAPGDYLSVDVDTIRSPAANLTVTIVFTQ